MRRRRSQPTARAKLRLTKRASESICSEAAQGNQGNFPTRKEPRGFLTTRSLAGQKLLQQYRANHRGGCPRAK